MGQIIINMFRLSDKCVIDYIYHVPCQVHGELVEARLPAPADRGYCGPGPAACARPGPGTAGHQHHQ